MADITHLFLRRHLRSGPTEWTRHSAGGRVRREGVGLSYAFRARTAVISEVPRRPPGRALGRRRVNSESPFS